MNIIMKMIIGIVLLSNMLFAQNKYILPEMHNTSLIRCVIAHNEIGVNEEKYARRVNEYLQSVGLSGKVAWCNAFQYWVMEGACEYYKQTNPMARSGAANSSYDLAKRKGLKTTYKPEQGDLIVWKTIDSWTGHIGMVVNVKGRSVITIEGNTSSYLVRTGGAVEKKTRHLYNPIGKLKVRGLIGFKSQVQ